MRLGRFGWTMAMLATGGCAAEGDAVIGVGNSDAGVPDVTAGDAECGATGQACCGYSTCSQGNTCSSGTCVPSAEAGGLDTDVPDMGAAETCPLLVCNGKCADTMNDPLNCGACNRVCDAGMCTNGLCDPGAPTVLASGQFMPASIAVDATNVYWTTWPSMSAPASRVYSCAIGGCGGTPTQLASNQSVADWMQDLVVTPQYLFWGSGENNTQDGVFQCGVAGCGGAAVNFFASPTPVAGIAVDGTNVYWGSQTDGSLLKCPLGSTCTSPVTLQPANAGWVMSVAVDGTNVYWIDTNVPAIYAHPITGGSTVALASGINYNPFALVATGGRVYWVDGGTTIKSVAVTGGTVTDFVTDFGPYDIATDGTNIYWTNNIVMVKGAVRKCAVGLVCTNPVTLAEGQDTAFSVAVDATSVYWTTNLAPNGQVLKAKK